MFEIISNDAWYLTRSSALLGFLLLYISTFLGLSVRTPLLNKIVKPIYSFKIHCWISLQALIFAGLHGIFLLFDKFINFNLGNVFIPFYPLTEIQSKSINLGFLALGIVAFYIMIILVATSYAKKYISQAVWRSIHFLNIGLFFIVFVHALYMGTDLKSGIVRDIFIYANAFLAWLFVMNFLSKLLEYIFKKKNEDLRQSEPPVSEERNNQDFRGRI